jgi:hypothetical protein
LCATPTSILHLLRNALNLRASRNNPSFQREPGTKSEWGIKVKIVKQTLAATLLMAMAITAAPVRSNAATQPCVMSSRQWMNTKLSQVETGSFRLTYDATAASTTQNAVTGLSAAGVRVAGI